MPWIPEDAPKHTRSADSVRLRRIWSSVANSVLDQTQDEGYAIRAANAAVLKARARDGQAPSDEDRDRR